MNLKEDMAKQEIKRLEDIFYNENLFKSIKEDYIPRVSQIEAAKKMYESLLFTKHFILEGSTGFGKTLSYLIPVFLYTIKNNSKPKTLIVTKGINLQEQLAYKDIPFVNKLINKLTDTVLKYTLIKGKQNYICFFKMSAVLNGQMFHMNESETEALKIITDWFVTSKTGDFSELSIKPSGRLLKHISCVSETDCKKKACPFNEQCFYQRRKSEAFKSNLIITNYHMLYQNTIIGGNKLLPEVDIVIFDEAHDAAKICRDFASKSLSCKDLIRKSMQFKELREKHRIPDNKFDSIKISESNVTGTFDELIRLFQEYFTKIFKYFFSNNKFQEDRIIDETISLPGNKKIIETLNYLIGKLENIAEFYSEENTDIVFSDYKNEAEYILNDVTSIIEHLIVYKRIMFDIYIKERYDSINNCYYFHKEFYEEKPGDIIFNFERVSLKFKPVKLGAFMHRNFLSEDSKVSVFTSATLSVNGNFKFLKDNVGLSKIEETKVIEFIGESPFDLKKNQLWYIPEDAMEGNSKEFDDNIYKQVRDIIVTTKGGALCLFTSIKNMNTVYLRLKPILEKIGIKILIDKDRSRLSLLNDFKRDKNSVLMATKSFFEGIDVPGDALRCVIIDKIPHPLKTDPIWAKIGREKNAFHRYFLPESIITLKQGIGRGNRSIDDRAVIAILDKRVIESRYSKSILNSFNYEKTITHSLKDVEKFLYPGIITIDEIEESMF